MDIRRLMLEGKIGLVGLASRGIPNRGSISDIRKYTNYVDGNIQYYSLLGSQNAIPKTGDYPVAPDKPPEKTPTKEDIIDDIAKRISDDISKRDEDRSKSDKDAKIEEDKKQAQIKEEEEKRKAEEEKASETIVEPDNQPPFILPDEKQDQLAYENYLKVRYGTNATSKIEIDKERKETKLFNQAVKIVNDLNTQITKYNSDNAQLWKDHFYNTIVKFGNFAIDAISDLAKVTTGGRANVIIDKVRDVIKYLSPKESKDFVGAIREIQNAIITSNPNWSKKWKKLDESLLEEMLSRKPTDFDKFNGEY